MSEATDAINRELVNWGDWRRTLANCGPLRLRSWWFPICMRGRVKQSRDWDRIVVDDRIAELTEKAVNTLPDMLIAALCEHYVTQGTVDQQAEALGCTKKTLYNRVDTAIETLQEMRSPLPIPNLKSI